MTKLKAVRIDPGYLWDPALEDWMYPDMATAANVLVEDCLNWGANTVYVFAYSPVYGPAYHTDWNGTAMQGRLATQNFLGEMVRAAGNDLKVIASVRMNQERNLVMAHPNWAARHRSGGLYQVQGAPPQHLSCWSQDYRVWFKKMLEDMIVNVGDLAGLDACEGTVAEGFESGPAAPDFSHSATASYGGQPAPQSPAWQTHLAQGLTYLHGILRGVATSKGMEAHVIHDLVSKGDAGSDLMDFADYAKGCGFDWKAICNLHYDWAVQGAIWQQRRRDHGVSFKPAWTGHAATKFGTRPRPASVRHAVHVEVTPWYPGESKPPRVDVGLDDFRISLEAALTHSDGVSVYSHHQLKSGPYTANAHAAVLQDVLTS